MTVFVAILLVFISIACSFLTALLIKKMFEGRK